MVRWFKLGRFIWNFIKAWGSGLRVTGERLYEAQQRYRWGCDECDEPTNGFNMCRECYLEQRTGERRHKSSDSKEMKKNEM